MTRKVLFSGIFLLFAVLVMHHIVLAESIDEAKARIRREVQEEMGSKAPLPPSPASPKDTSDRERVKKSQPRKKVSDASLPFDIDPAVAFRLFSLMTLFAVIPAAVAKMKGRSFIAWWVLGTLFFIFVLPISLFLKPVKAPAQAGQRPAAKKREGPDEGKPAEEERPAKTGKEDLLPQGKTDSAAIEAYENIERLAALKEKGILTEEEFRAKKNELLSRI